MKLTKILLVVTLVLCAVMALASCGEPACEHAYSESVTTQPTCTAEGVKTFTCANCGDTYTEPVPMVEHNYEMEGESPTCTTSGTKTYTCKVCGNTYTEEIEPATGHDYKETVTEPTCSTAGSITYTCKCGDTYTEAGAAATGVHVYKTIVLPLTDAQKAEYPNAIGIRAEACEGCGAVKEGAAAASLVLLNLDFETTETKLLGYVESVDGIAPFVRGSGNTDRGFIQDGVWYNTSNGQVLFDESLGLAELDTFTISFDAVMGGAAPTSGDYIIGYGSSKPNDENGQGGMAAGYYFNLKITTEGKLNVQSNFTALPKQDEKFAGYTFEDRNAWYHMDIIVDMANGELEIYAGKYTDETLATLEGYTLIGKTEGMNFGGMGNRTHPCFRLSDKQGIVAMDNFVISVPMAK